ncbi:MAG: glycosyl hydrolase family 28-related protein [Sphingomicrobium sp.]
MRTVGARGDGRTDDTAAFKAALKAADVVSVPAGTYIISQVDVPGGKTIVTDGANTILRQRPGLPSATPVLKITGSNVEIGSLKVVGNIATDKDEWMHAIAIHPNRSTGNISDVTIGDIIGENIRGDVVEIYPTAPYDASRIRIGHLVGSNVLRCVGSVCGGNDIEIRSCTGWRVGYAHFIVEPDAACTPARNVRVGQVKGRHAIIAPVSPSVMADGVAIETLDLSPAHAFGSLPEYSHGASIASTGLLVRNCQSLSIGTLRAGGFQGPAIKQIYNRGELSKQELRIDQAEISDCNRAGSPDDAYLVGAPDVTHLVIGRLVITLDGEGANGIQSCYGAEIGEVEAVLGRGTRLFRDIRDGVIGPVYARSGAGTLIISGERTEFRGGDIAVDVLGSYSRRLRFRDASLKGGFEGAGCNSHALENASLNSRFYRSASGVGC